MSAADPRQSSPTGALPRSGRELWRLDLCATHASSCVAFGAEIVGTANPERTECALCAAPPAHTVSIPPNGRTK